MQSARSSSSKGFWNIEITIWHICMLQCGYSMSVRLTILCNCFLLIDRFYYHYQTFVRLQLNRTTLFLRPLLNIGWLSFYFHYWTMNIGFLIYISFQIYRVLSWTTSIKQIFIPNICLHHLSVGVVYSISYTGLWNIIISKE